MLFSPTNITNINGIQANVQVDSFVKSKKLECQTGSGKCQWIQIGNDECPSQYFVNGKPTDQAEKYKYLGDILSNKLDLLYTSRAEKANGYRVSCVAMLTEISMGYRLFSIAKLLHQSIFFNGTMVNMESWPNFTTARLEIFEKIEQHYLRTVLSAHSKVAIGAIYIVS